MWRTGWIVLLIVAGCRGRAEELGPPRQTRVEGSPAAAAASASSVGIATKLTEAPSASTRTPRIPPAPEKPPRIPRELADSPPRPTGAHAGFLGPVDISKDRAWVMRLASAPISAIKRNSGGTSLTLRVRFEDGERAVWKPEQKKGAGSFRSEIAAWHVDRLLGFGRTAVVVGRSIGKNHLLAQLDYADTDPEFMARLEAELVAHDGRVAGAMIAWHPGALTSAEPPKDWTAPDAGVTEARLYEWSDMMVFDFLIDNTDRWSGGNILSLGKGGPLIFLDNAAGFSPGRAARNEMSSARLTPVCRFRKQTVDALTQLAEEKSLGSRLMASLTRDPLTPVLSERQGTAIDVRLAPLADHVHACQKEER